MTKVITYGTYDLFHEGHYKLLKRAKELGDYLIVGVTSENFDKERGKLNVRDSLIKRIENVKNTGFADEIIIEEYQGQKVDDIKRYKVDIFTVGSDWEGHFDYLNEFCKVVYLQRTPQISSTSIRKLSTVRLGIIGAETIVRRFFAESKYVSGIEIVGIYDTEDRLTFAKNYAKELDVMLYENLDNMLNDVDAVYICTPPKSHFKYVKYSLEHDNHVICEFPFMLNAEEAKFSFDLAKQKSKILFHGLKTAYCPAFKRLAALAKSGLIGNILSVDARFTQVLGEDLSEVVRAFSGGSVNSLGEYPALAFVKILGTDFKSVEFFSHYINNVDTYTRFHLKYDKVLTSATVAINAKSEGSLIITGTKGYFYVPAPWWKTEYFEARFEDINKNMKYFYKFQGEGLRYEIAEFVQSIIKAEQTVLLTPSETITMTKILEQYQKMLNVEKF